MESESFIGKKVIKVRPKNNRPSKKPFKSGNISNTISGVVNHPFLLIPAFTFEEDDSIVECRRCKVIE